MQCSACWIFLDCLFCFYFDIFSSILLGQFPFKLFAFVLNPFDFLEVLGSLGPCPDIWQSLIVKKRPEEPGEDESRWHGPH